MRQSSVRSGKLSYLIGQEVGDRINAYLRKIYPTKTADMVSADTGIAAANVAKWLSRTSLPNCRAMLALTYAYGPDFLSTILPNVDWLDRAKRDARTADLERQIADKRRELEALRS